MHVARPCRYFETENDAYAYAAEKKFGCGLGFEVEF